MTKADNQANPWNDPWVVVRLPDGRYAKVEAGAVPAGAVRTPAYAEVDEAIQDNAPGPFWRAIGVLRRDLPAEFFTGEGAWSDLSPGSFHLGQGMAVRNLLRENGCGEAALNVANLDDVYMQLLDRARELGPLPREGDRPPPPAPPPAPPPQAPTLAECAELADRWNVRIARRHRLDEMEVETVIEPLTFVPEEDDA